MNVTLFVRHNNRLNPIRTWNRSSSNSTRNLPDSSALSRGLHLRVTATDSDGLLEAVIPHYAQAGCGAGPAHKDVMATGSHFVAASSAVVTVWTTAGGGA